MSVADGNANLIRGGKKRVRIDMSNNTNSVTWVFAIRVCMRKNNVALVTVQLCGYFIQNKLPLS